MKYNPKKEDFYILKTKFNESYRDELYDDGLNLCFQGNEEKSNDNNDFPDVYENPYEERYDYSDDICAEYKHLYKLVKRLQVELSLVFCPNSRIKELFGSGDVIEGTAYRAILDEVDSIIAKIDVNKKSLKKDIENSIKEFLSFVHSTELAIYQNFDIMQINEPEYDSVQSYLFGVSDRFTVLGETARYFFGNIYDMVSDYNVKILDCYKETIDGFLYSNNIGKSSKSEIPIGNIIKQLTDYNEFKDIHFPSLYKDDNKLIEVCNKLIDGCFLDKSTSTDDFVYFFSGRGKTPEQNLIWIGNNVELAFFLDSYFTKFKNDIPEKWKIAQKIFNRKNLRQSLKNSENSTDESLNQMRYDTFNAILE